MSLSKIDQYIQELLAVKNYDVIFKRMLFISGEAYRYSKAVDEFLEFVKSNHILDQTIEKRFREYEQDLKKKALELRKNSGSNFSFLAALGIDLIESASTNTPQKPDTKPSTDNSRKTIAGSDNHDEHSKVAG